MKIFILLACLMIAPKICLATSYRCVNLLSDTATSVYYTVSGGQQHHQNMIDIMIKTINEYGVDLIVNGYNVRTGFKVDENDVKIEVKGEPNAVEYFLTRTQLRNIDDRRQLVQVAEDFINRYTASLKSSLKTKEDNLYIEFPIAGGNNRRSELLDFMRVVANMHNITITSIGKLGDFTNFLFQDGQDFIRIEGSEKNINLFMDQMTNTNVEHINIMFSHIYSVFKDETNN